MRLPCLFVLAGLFVNSLAHADREGQAPRETDSPRGADGARREGDQKRALRLRVSEDGVVIGDRIIAHQQLRGLLSKSETKSAIIVANENINLRAIQNVMDALRDNGIRDIRLTVAKPEARRDRPRRDDGEGGERNRLRRDGDERGEKDRPMRDRDAQGEESRPRRNEDDRREGERARRDREPAGEGDRVRERSDPERRTDERTRAKLQRIYQAWDKNGDGGVTFEEWVSIKEGKLSADQRDREKRWFERADANQDKKVTEREWITWKLNPGRE